MAPASRAVLESRAPARDERSSEEPWPRWVSDARRGDREAFALLHGHFKGLVHAIVIARVPASDSQDLTQDVFVTMMQKLSTLEDEQAFPAWLMQLARFAVARHLRDRPRTEPLPEHDERAAPDRSGLPDARKVLAALQALPEAYAETLAMRLVEGMSGPEIAQRTGLSPGSVRVNLHRGMAKLRERLGLPPRAQEEGASDE